MIKLLTFYFLYWCSVSKLCHVISTENVLCYMNIVLFGQRFGCMKKQISTQSVLSVSLFLLLFSLTRSFFLSFFLSLWNTGLASMSLKDKLN